MDIEMRFMYALLSASRAEQDVFFSRQLPKGIFNLREKEIAFVYKFREKHGKYPSVALFNNSFDKLAKHSDPIDAVLTPILNRALFNQMGDLITRVKKQVDEQGDIAGAFSLFKADAAKLTNFSIDYTDLDLGTSRGALARYIERVKAEEEGVFKLDSPWPTMNKLIHHLSPGDTVVYAARSSMGKSWLVLFWAHYLASQKIKVMVVSEEMLSEKVEDRIEAIRFRLPYDKLRTGSLPPAVLRKYKIMKRAVTNLPYPLTICGSDNVGSSVSSVEAKIEQYKPDVVVVDGAYLLNAEGVAAKASERERFAWISKRFKQIAKAKKVIIFLVIQMNRDAEDKSGTAKGSFKSVFGSDSWAQDCDFLFDLSGQRGSNSRKQTLLKGRDTDIGEVNIRFQLNPYPDFSEVGKAMYGQAIKSILNQK